ncbi:MAG: Crp/Fnr family transcriptional regulator [Aureispira sp.]
MHPLQQHIHEIIPLSQEEFDDVLSYFETMKRQKFQYIVQEGEPTNKEFWVIKGCLKSSFIDANGKEYIVQFAMENWWVTDYGAFENRTLAKLSIDCLENCDLLYITYENKERLMTAMPKMQQFWARKTKKGYIALQERILSLLKSSAKERYELLFKQYPELFQRISKKTLAAYLGVSRETLSRLYKA